jgi:hypothetical protein
LTNSSGHERLEASLDVSPAVVLFKIAHIVLKNHLSTYFVELLAFVLGESNID